MGIAFSRLLPGFAGFAAAVGTPWHSVDTTLIRNAVILLLSLVILGAVAAFIARKVRRSTPDSAFRRSVKNQGQSTDRQMLQTLQLAIDEGSASLDFDVAGHIAQPDQPAANLPALSPAQAGHIDKVVAADTSNATLPAAPPSPSAPSALELSPTVALESAREMHPDTPSPWDETASSLMAAFSEPETNRESRPLTRSIGEVARETAQNSGRISEPMRAHDPTPAPEENTPLALPRLSELRGMCFSQALRELDRAKRSAQPTPGSITGSTPGPDPEIDALLRAIAPFESLIMQMGSATPQTENSGAASENGAKKYAPQSDFLPSDPVAPAMAHRLHGEDKGRNLPGRKPPGGVPDQLQILPSRRGQYKKKT